MKYESEYQYQFKLLKMMRDEQDETIGDPPRNHWSDMERIDFFGDAFVAQSAKSAF